MRFELLENRLCLSGGGEDTLAGLSEPQDLLDPQGAFANHAVTSDPGVQQMPSVAVNPRDPQHVAIAYMDYSLLTTGYAGLGAAVSRDGGATWRHSTIPLPENFDQGAANPVARFDDQGRLFVSFMAVTFLGDNKPGLTNPSGTVGNTPRLARTLGFESNNGVFVAHSDDGGAAWQAPVAVASHRFDGTTPVPFDINPDFAIDTFRTLPDGRPNPNYGNLYAVWARYYPGKQFPGQPNSTGGSQVLFAVSEDAGQTWRLRTQSVPGSSVPQPVILDRLNTGAPPPGAGAINWPHLAIGPEGDIYVSSFFRESFDVFHSRDGGQSFAAPHAATGAGLPFGDSFVISPGPALGSNRFRLQVVRSLVADPSRPGHAYVTEAVKTVDALGNVVDAGDIWFSRTADYGVTWKAEFRFGERTVKVLNDDNDNLAVQGLENDVAIGQALPAIAADAQGNVAVVWYDARRDPHNRRLEVFGSASADGGASFGANFRVTDTSFDANRGRFTDVNGADNFYLGDFVGLAVADGAAYSAWSDTRNGSQDIFFARVPLDPNRQPLGDRWEPNQGPPTATELGQIIQNQRFPKLSVAPGDEDWFRLTATADPLTVLVQPDNSTANLRVELWDESGESLLAAGADAEGEEVRGARIRFSARTGQAYLVRVFSDEAASSQIQKYTLNVESLTGNLGVRVQGRKAGAVEPGAEALYLLTSAAAGSIEVALSSNAGALNVEILDANNVSRKLATGSAQPLPGGGQVRLAGAAVEKGQAVLLRAFGDVLDRADFQLEFANLDQFATAQNQRLSVAAGNGPSQAELADLDGDGDLDIAVTNALSDTLSVALGNGDGAFQAPRQFPLGAFDNRVSATVIGFPTFGRGLTVSDLNGDNLPDVVALNSGSSDISVLLGRGDGAFQPQRRFDATAIPFALADGDVNDDGRIDLVVVDSSFTPARVAVLLGRGDGTFQPAKTFDVPIDAGLRPFTGVTLGELNGDDRLDLLITDDQTFKTFVFLGNGDGTFRSGTSFPGAGRGTALFDLNGDGKLDLVNPVKLNNTVIYALGNGEGTFQNSTEIPVGQSPLDLAIGDFGSAVELGHGIRVLGPPDGVLDLVVVNSGIPQPLFHGPAEVVLLPGKTEQGQFAGFALPLKLADAKGPQSVRLGDVNEDGALDAVVTDQQGLFVIFGRRPVFPAPDSPAAARDLGVVVHVAQPTLTITPGHDEVYYRLAVPTEAVAGAGDQVLDFSSGFAHLEGAGLGMEVLDAAGNVLAASDRVRVQARQNETLFVRIFGREDAQGVRGTGAYTLIVNTLPQVVSVEAQALLPGQGGLPGGPTTSLVLVLQGDRLDPQAAEKPDNYRVTWLGPDGAAGTGDERAFEVGAGLEASRKAVYNPGGNIDIATGIAYPTAMRQTVTLLFAEPLPAGSYQIEVAPLVQAAPFNQEEPDLLTPRDGFTGHPVVSLVNGQVREGASPVVRDLVFARGSLGDFREFESGTRFLTQFHDDLGALLDAILTATGENPQITQQLLDQVIAAFGPALGPVGERLTSLLVIVLDPVPFSVADREKNTLKYDQQTNTVDNRLPRTNVNVAGNVEVVTIAQPRGAYELTIPFATPLVRGGVVYLGGLRNEVRLLTDEVRQGGRSFTLSFGEEAALSTPFDPSVAARRAVDREAAALGRPIVLGRALAVPVSLTGAVFSGGDFRSESLAMARASNPRAAEADSWTARMEAFWRRYAGRLAPLRRGLTARGALEAALALENALESDPTLPWRAMSNLVNGAMRSLTSGAARAAGAAAAPRAQVAPDNAGAKGRRLSEAINAAVLNLAPNESRQRNAPNADPRNLQNANSAAPNDNVRHSQRE